MTSTSFFDAPGGIRKEGNSQTLTFTRETGTTGNVCWSPTPPSPATGCGTPSGNYSGGVLIGSRAPIDQNNKPKDGVCCYTADPTMNQMEFAGDKLDGAYVLWSSNTDISTGCVTVTGLDPTCSTYYFAFFAIDNVCRYNQDGIYSYSQDLRGPKIECVSGKQTIQLNGAKLTDTLPGTADLTINHPIELVVDGNPISLVLRGPQLSTYQSVVTELETAWMRTFTSITSEYPPLYGQFVLEDQKWYQHTGYQYQTISPIVQTSDPAIKADGDLWYDITTGQLQEYVGSSWTNVDNTIVFSRDPSIPTTDMYWFDGITARQFDGNVWINKPHLITGDDPLTPPSLTGAAVWKNGDVFSRWNISRNRWIPTPVLVYDGDTDIIPVGTLWFDTTTVVTNSWNGTDWQPVASVISTSVPSTPVAHQLWVDPVAKTGKKYNTFTATWDTVSVTFYHKPITEETAGDLHFIPLTGALRTYDGLTNSWKIVTEHLFNQNTDPTQPPQIVLGTIWLNTSQGLWYVRDSGEWQGIEMLQSVAEPSNIIAGFWYNPTTLLWYERNGNVWTPVAPVISANDPTTPLLGTTWFDGTELRQFDGTGWSLQQYETTLTNVSIGTRWIDLNQQAHAWDGKQWVSVDAPYAISVDQSDNVVISSTTCGSESYVEIVNSPLLTSTLKLILCRPVPGNDGTTGIPMYSEIGVGTDGSSDERRHIIDNLYMRLGAPTISVELTREQMDLAVQRGLDYMRRDSGAGYNRGYFFLDLHPGQQHYTLTSKAVGFNKIVDVLYLYRPRGGFLNSTFGGEIYGQQLIQQLYVSGTFDILSYHLLASYQSVVAKLFASELQYSWTERTRKLSILRKIARTERILVDAVIEKTEQDLFTDRMTKNWIENWALTEAKIMLGDMRGKFSTLPGAGGAISLNADVLKADAAAMQEQLRKELDDYNASDIETWGLGSSITKG